MISFPYYQVTIYSPPRVFLLVAYAQAFGPQKAYNEQRENKPGSKQVYRESVECGPDDFWPHEYCVSTASVHDQARAVTAPVLRATPTAPSVGQKPVKAEPRDFGGSEAACVCGGRVGGAERASK